MHISIRQTRERIQAIVFIIIVGSVGVLLLTFGHAATQTASVQPDLGSISARATSLSDLSASGGNAVSFGAFSPASLAIHVNGNMIVDRNNKQIQMVGVNFSGTQDSCRTNTSFSYLPYTEAEAAGIATWHTNIVRVALNEDCWLGINNVVVGGSAYQSALKSWVARLNSAGMRVILSLQFAAPGTVLASYPPYRMPDTDHSVDFWTQVAAAYKANPSVMFDLYNEPALGGVAPTTTDWDCWLNGCHYTDPSPTSAYMPFQVAGMQQLVTAIRNTGSTQPLLIGGLDWDGDPCGTHTVGGNGGACIQVSRMPHDPLNQLIVSSHNYKAGSACYTLACSVAVKQATDAANIPLIIGELGQYDCQVDYINSFMAWADTQKVSYLAWSWEVNNEGTSNSIKLLSNNDGTPDTYCPNGAAFKAHFLSQNP